MTYKNLIAGNLPTYYDFKGICFEMLELVQSIPADVAECHFSISTHSLIIVNFRPEAKRGAPERLGNSIMFSEWHTSEKLAQLVEELRLEITKPVPAPTLTYTETLLEQLKAERLEVIRLRNIIKLSNPNE